MKELFRKLFIELAGMLGSDKIAQDVSGTLAYSGQSKLQRQPVGIEEMSRGLNLVIYNANGGKVLQFWEYDPTKDRHVANLHIVPDGQDLGEELAMIITRESLSR